MSARRRTVPVIATALTLAAGAVAMGIVSRPADAANQGLSVSGATAAGDIPLPKLGHWRNRPYDDGLTWRQRMDAAEAQFGPFAGHWRQFKPIGKSGQLSTAEKQALADGRRLFSNWKPLRSGQTWASVAAGANDAMIQAAADDWARGCDPNGECWITFWHEPENDLGGTGWRTADHRAMFRRAAAIFRARAPEVKIVWTMMGYEGHQALYPALWPGDEYVDYIGHDPYLNATSSPAGLATKIIDRSHWFRANISAKPVVVAEWGTDLHGARGTVQHRADALEGVRARLREVAAAGVIELAHFDSREHYFSTSDTSGADAAAYLALKRATESGGGGVTTVSVSEGTQSTTSSGTAGSQSPATSGAQQETTAANAELTDTATSSTKPANSGNRRTPRDGDRGSAWQARPHPVGDVILADHAVLVGDISERPARSDLTDTLLMAGVGFLLLTCGAVLRRRTRPARTGAARSGAHRRI